MNYLICTPGNTQLLPSAVLMNIREWKTIEEEQTFIRELGMREAAFDPQFNRAGITVFTET